MLLYDNKRQIDVYRFAVEVAYQISILMDVSGTGDIRRKGVTPKEYISCVCILGHMVKNYMTVIFV